MKAALFVTGRIERKSVSSPSVWSSKKTNKLYFIMLLLPTYARGEQSATISLGTCIVSVNGHVIDRQTERLADWQKFKFIHYLHQTLHIHPEPAFFIFSSPQKTHLSYLCFTFVVELSIFYWLFQLCSVWCSDVIKRSHVSIDSKAGLGSI